MLAHILTESLARRPTVYNVLHRFHCLSARTQMIAEERECLRLHARGRYNALEIGTFMGVSARDIVGVLAPTGVLTCVDPWPAVPDATLAITRREFARHHIEHRVRLVRATSRDAEPRLGRYDFIFVDGDHSEEGIATDWRIVRDHLAPDGIVALHDTSRTPEPRPESSIRYFERVISKDPEFTAIGHAHSLNVLARHG